MIKVITNEYREGDLAVQVTVITFFNIPIFKSRKTTTNNVAVMRLTTSKQSLNIKGFV